MSSPYTYGNGNTAGFFNPKQSARTPKENKIKWTAENDAKLYKYFMEREIAAFEWEIIRKEFPENPTPKAIQERVGKLRAKTKHLLAAKGIHPYNKKLHSAEVKDLDDEEAVNDDATASTPSKTVSGNNKRKQPPSTLSGNDTGNAADAELMPPPPKKSRLEEPANAAPPEAWMPADGLKASETLLADPKVIAWLEARRLRREAATAAAGATENRQAQPARQQSVGVVTGQAGNGVGGSGMEAAAVPAGETALQANDAGGASTGGDGAGTGGDGEMEIDPDDRTAAEILMSFPRSGGGS